MNIPDSVETIGEGAFSECTGLDSINIPCSVQKIEREAFNGCRNLKHVTLSKNLKVLGSKAFGECISLQQIEIPKSLEKCGEDGIAGPFYGCSSLKEVSFEKGITKIEENLFADCDGLEQVKLPDTVTVIGAKAFEKCSNLRKVDIPNSIEYMEKYCFSRCTALENIVVPDSVTEIEEGIFWEDTNLQKVRLSANLISIPEYTFFECKKLEAIELPSAIQAVWKESFYACESLKKITFSMGMETIGEGAFKNCTGLEKVLMSNTVSSIRKEAFYGCKSLTDITLGNCLEQIDEKAFYACAKLSSIVIPYQVTTIGENAFSNCTNLTQVTLPRSITSISTNAFSYPKKITMYGPANCYAQIYADEKGIKYVEQYVRASSVDMDIKEKISECYDGFQLTATITPQNFTEDVWWTSSNEEIATVSNTGYVRIHDTGNVIITITAGKVKSSCRIKVQKMINRIQFCKEDVVLNVGDKCQLEVKIFPYDASDQRLSYSSSNPEVAEVSQKGVVTAKKKGKTEIKAIATDGSDIETVCYVTVTGENKVKSISLNKTSAVLKKGKKLTLKTKILPSDASNKKVNWKSQNKKIATVDSNGNVIAKASGKTQIIVTSAENNNCRAVCTITVPYNINYKMNKGQNNALNPTTYYAKKITLKNPTRKGYVFGGWYTDAKLKNRIKTITSNAKRDYTLYAKWMKVKVAKTSITCAKNSKSKQILLKYKKISGAKGYEVSYSTDKKFKKAVTTKSVTKTSYRISKLKKGKIYYVRVRAYKIDSAGKKVYGNYSSVKKVKIDQG